MDIFQKCIEYTEPQKAKEKGLNVIDASCLDVIKTHDLIKKKLSEGYEILYIGKIHPIHAYTFSGHSINFQKIHKLYAYLHEPTNPRKDKPT